MIFCKALVLAKSKRKTNKNQSNPRCQVVLDCKCLHEIIRWNPALLQCRTQSCIASKCACRQSSRDRLRFKTLCCRGAVCYKSVISKCQVCKIVFKERQGQQPVCDLATKKKKKCKQRSVMITADIRAAATRPWIFLDIGPSVCSCHEPQPFSKTRP